MSDHLSPPSSETTETTTIPLVDVEAEHEKRVQLKNLLQKNYMYIPERYLAQMAKTGLLDRFVTIIQNESVMFRQIKDILHKHNINIPPEFYSSMMENNFFELFLQLIHEVNREEENERSKFIQENFYESRKRRPRYCLDNGYTNGNDIDERQTKKRKCSPVSDLSISNTVTDSPPSTTNPDDADEDDEEESEID